LFNIFYKEMVKVDSSQIILNINVPLGVSVTYIVIIHCRMVSYRTSYSLPKVHSHVHYLDR